MTAVTTDIQARVEQQRVTVVQRLLWVLLAVIAANLGLSVARAGREILANPAFVPNMLAIPVIGLALWLNAKGSFRSAILIVMGLTLGSATLTLMAVGLAGNPVSILFFAVPIVLAGLVLSRRALVVTTAWSVGTLLLVPLMAELDLLLVRDAASNPGWQMAFESIVMLLLVSYFLDRFGIVHRSTLTDALDYQVRLKEQADERARVREELEEERQVTDAIVQGLPGIFALLDEDGHFTRWNRNFDRVLGLSDEEMAAVSPEQLVAVADRPKIHDHFARVFEQGSAITELNLLTRRGEELPYLLNGARIKLGNKVYAAGVALDRSEIAAARKNIETLNEELQERLERITSLHEIDRAITGSLDLSLTLDVVLQQVTRRLKVDAASILLLQPASERLVFGSSRGFEKNTTLHDTSLRVGEGMAGRAALERQRIVIQDPDAFRRAFEDSGSIVRQGFQSYVAMPLIAKGHLLGVLELFHRSRLDPTDDWYSFLATLSTQAAIALDSATMFESLERSNTELRLAYDRTIEGWARALDLRDEETEGHSRRVTDMTVSLAKRMGVPREDLVHVRRGALLHDIGKMAVPDSILLKPGKLDQEEWEIMKRHPTYAAELLGPIDFLRPALVIPLYHHEKWDGSGYPHGLKAKQIPIEARIFSVVDVYDALTSKRPYREAWQPQEARRYIEEQAEGHFDPTVVGSFLEMKAMQS
ncbi:MAG TPA: HD domain-containing phosphohydrolase [Trueperaceae bacterium]